MVLFKKFYWIFGTSPKGRPVLLGPFKTEEDATEEGDELEDARVFALKTANQQKATRIVRRKLLKTGASTDDVLERQLHERGLRREIGSGTKKIEVKTTLRSSEDMFEGDPFKDGE